MSLTMKADVAAELSKRLRSGDYKQGDAFLCMTNRDDGPLYCCLGVLSEMAVEAGVVHMKEANGVRYYASPDVYESADFGWYSRTLAPAVVEWAGIKSNVEREEDDYGHRMDDYEGVGRFAERTMDTEAVRSHGGVFINLASMNDSAVPFEEIAQFIDDKVVKE